jgi:hypothetical protein
VTLDVVALAHDGSDDGICSRFLLGWMWIKGIPSDLVLGRRKTAVCVLGQTAERVKGTGSRCVGPFVGEPNRPALWFDRCSATSAVNAGSR